jgi:hypothetical protein
LTDFLSSFQPSNSSGEAELDPASVSFLSWFIIQREPSDTAKFSPYLKKDPAQKNNISKVQIVPSNSISRFRYPESPRLSRKPLARRTAEEKLNTLHAAHTICSNMKVYNPISYYNSINILHSEHVSSSFLTTERVLNQL